MASRREFRRHVVNVETPVRRNNQSEIVEVLHCLNINQPSLVPGIDGFARSLVTSVAYINRAGARQLRTRPSRGQTIPGGRRYALLGRKERALSQPRTSITGIWPGRAECTLEQSKEGSDADRTGVA